VDRAERVLARLERIESLAREPVPSSRLLGELRALVREAQDWAGSEGDPAPARRSRIFGKERKE
jgi:hypothetical protein